MALYVLLAIIGLACIRGLMRWRDALFAIVLIAAVQDPLRKLVPGTPGYLMLASVPVLLVATLALIGGTRSWWSGFERTFPGIGRNVAIFVLACIPAALQSAFYGPGSWMLTVLGALSYSVLFLAMLLGYHFLRSERELRRFLGFYCVVTAVMLSGTMIEYFGMWSESGILGTGPLGYEWIRHVPGYQVQMVSGFYRSPDVMGWHAVSAVMLATILALTARGQARWLWAALGAVALVALLLCGRRKMVYMLPTFAGMFLIIHWGAARAGRTVAMTASLLLPLAAGLLFFDRLVAGDDTNVVRYYTETASETLDRFEVHGFQSLLTTYDQAGFFGSGLGVATPGSHLLDVARPRVWQESGPSRVLVELGVPGMAAFLLLVASVLVAGWRATKRHLRARSRIATYAVGLLSFFLANVGSLMVSGQILADPNIATFLGLSIGIVLSLSRVPAVAPARVRPRAAMPYRVRSASRFVDQPESAHA